MSADYLIVVEGDGATNYSAYCPDVPGVVATGETVDACVVNMREALTFHMKGMRMDGEAVPRPTSRAATVHIDAA